MLRDVAIIFLLAIVASYAIKTYVARSFFIPSPSMEETLLVGDRVVVNRLQPTVFPLQRGDIIVFEDPGGWLGGGGPVSVNPLTRLVEEIGLVPTKSSEFLIKRVIGLPGDRVQCCDDHGRLSVNGVSIDEPYVHVPRGAPAVSLSHFSETVPDGSLWVMGDNRYNSADSRAHVNGPTRGFVPLSRVVGRAFVITWPLGRFGWLDDGAGAFRQVPNAAPARRTKRAQTL